MRCSKWTKPGPAPSCVGCSRGAIRPSACIRRKAVFLIAQQNEPGTEDILLESVRSDPDPEVRRQAVFWLSQVSTDRAVGALDSILRFSNDQEIQEQRCLRPIPARQPPGSAGAAHLRRAEGGPGGDAGAAPSSGWANVRAPENAAFLRSLYGRLTGEELKKKVLFSLSQLGGEENGRWLLGIARDTSEKLEMRKQALFWAGQGGVSIDELTRLYANVAIRTCGSSWSSSTPSGMSRRRSTS